MQNNDHIYFEESRNKENQKPENECLIWYKECIAECLLNNYCKEGKDNINAKKFKDLQETNK